MKRAREIDRQRKRARERESWQGDTGRKRDRLCARHGAAWKEVRDTDVTLDLEARRVQAQTYLAAISHHPPCVSVSPLPPSPSVPFVRSEHFAFRRLGARLRLQIPRKIISIYAKQRERLNPCSDNIDSIQPALPPHSILSLRLSVHVTLSLSLCR